jgi:hypothetical protein
VKVGGKRPDKNECNDRRNDAVERHETDFRDGSREEHANGSGNDVRDYQSPDDGESQVELRSKHVGSGLDSHSDKRGQYQSR